jgi:hypothetical protein
MPPRENDIRNQIEGMEGQDFERFSRELLSREMYPGLNPTSRTHDLGEDARTEPSTRFRQGGKWISLAISKEATYRKLKNDCDRCLDTEREIDILVFVTAGNPRTDTIDRWKELIKHDYGWDLEVRAIVFLAPFACRPQYESLVDDYLHVGPPGDDFIQDIEMKFGHFTDANLAQARITIPGMSESLPRREVDTIEEQLSQGRRILLSGEAGTGKSGIAAMLARKSRESGKITLLIDARHLGNVNSEGELRLVFDLNGPVYLAIERIARYKPSRIIIDQIDNIIGQESAKILVRLITEWSRNVPEVEIMLVCRNTEMHEKQLLSEILPSGFDEIVCRELSEDDVQKVLRCIGIQGYGREVISLGRNLLNLELMADIHIHQSEFDFSIITDEIYLWDAFIATWQRREGKIGEEMYAKAVALARLGLNDPDGFFQIGIPASQTESRLESGGVITQVEGRIYRFRHEKFQDFIYARDAADLRRMPKEILEEILEYRSPNVLEWVDKIYLHRGSTVRAQFLKEMYHD